MFGWFVKKKIETPAEQKLEDIRNILFPPLKLQEERAEDGSLVKFHIDSSVDSNVEAVTNDLMDGYADANGVKTLQDVNKRLVRVRELLEAYIELDEDAQYIIVDRALPDMD